MKTFYQRAPAVSLHLQKPGKTRVDELVASRIWEHVPSNLPLFFLVPSSSSRRIIVQMIAGWWGPVSY